MESDSETETHVMAKGSGWLELPGLKLTVVEGPDRGREVTAKRGTVRVGTASDNDLVLTDGSISRRHLEVRLRTDEVHVKDLGSTNGSTVDGVRIMEAVLAPASLIRLGETAIRVTPVEEPVVVPISNRTSFGGLIGKSSAMRAAFAILERAAPTDATVLITGETGTGKELAAEAIHQHSQRADGPFVTIDCGAIAATLVESELFGHVRGAFTGAANDRRGVFEEADGGTLFLDEIGELPLDMQPKLLRALEKREVRRVGASTPRKINVRMVAATNRDLAEEVNRGNFREDLYFRLAVVEVSLPPLRARREDIPMLVQSFAQRLAPGEAPLSAEMLAALAARPFPGNVRELRNAVERAAAMSSGAPEGTAPPAEASAQSAELMERFFRMPLKDATEQWIELFHRGYLEHVLRESRGSVIGAARIAGVNRKFIHRLLKRYGMSARDDDSET